MVSYIILAIVCFLYISLTQIVIFDKNKMLDNLTDENNKNKNLVNLKDKEIDDLRSDFHKEKKTIEVDAEANVTALIEKHRKEVAALIEKYESKEYLMGVIESQYQDAYGKYKELLERSEELENFLRPFDCGIYEPLFDFEDSETYKNERLQALEDAKRMVRDKEALDIGIESAEKTKIAKLALLAFNSVCDSCVSDVRWDNVFKFEQKIKRTFETINEAIVGNIGVEIKEDYLNVRLKELHLAYEYKLKKQREKEEQDNIKALMREQEKAEREIQAALIKADAEEKKYLSRFEKISSTLSTLQGDRLLKAEEQIRELEARLAEVRENKERALSMAQQTKRGHVYIISNIGSFGENIYKIGLTRRLDPMDRVRELGDASVPFPFDVHAMIFSEDAPQLEATLHQRFADRRVNMINNRKEFFNVTLDEIAGVAREYDARVEFTLLAEASDYRQTLAIKAPKDHTAKEEISPLTPFAS